ncbi:MAG: hypothetical protein LCH77_13415 [Actinobacteria bacterium]|nr:hypothetical protein [Actinomycetota bacterium]
MRPSRGRKKILLSNRLAFGLVFVVVNLHILRNLAALPYLTVYAITVAWVLTRLIGKKPIVKMNVPTLWVLLSIFGFMTTAVISGSFAGAFGLVRFLFAFPIFLALAAFSETLDDVQDHMRTMVMVFAIGCLSVPLQFVTGPIAFFAADAERAGIDRYASVFGSLTSLGVAAGSYIALSHGLPGRTRILSTLSISIGGIASLSKAAIANIALGLLTGPLSGRKRLGRATFGLIFSVMLLVAAVWQSESLSRSLRATAISFGVDSGVKTNDLSFTASAIDRLTRLPMENWAGLEALGSPLAYLTGGGFGMASTALVPAEASLAPMAHNQFAEFVSVFGVVGGGAFVGICILLGLRLLRRWRNEPYPFSGPAFFAFAMWTTNSFFANGTAYQPSMASVLFFCMFVAILGARAEESATHVSQKNWE